MQKIFFDRQGRLRNGWWIAVFAAIFIASQGVYRPVSKALQHQGIEGIWLSPLPVVFLLLVTGPAPGCAETTCPASACSWTVAG